jgi:hypothetical protein
MTVSGVRDGSGASLGELALGGVSENALLSDEDAPTHQFWKNEQREKWHGLGGLRRRSVPLRSAVKAEIHQTHSIGKVTDDSAPFFRAVRPGISGSP